MSLLIAAVLFLSAQEPQVGARSKALGGAGTAFEDDPHSLWLNPAGIAAQPRGLAVSYQTYTFYEESGDPPDGTRARANLNEPVFIPSFLGAVLQVGTPELPQAVGLCLATPYHLYLPFSGPNPTTMPPAEVIVSEETFHRLRISYALDIGLHPAGDEGFFTHVALGIGADLAFARFESNHFPGDTISRDHNFRLSGGAGLLMGLYDNGQSLRVSLGLAYQAPASFDLAPSAGVVPFFDWPQQLQAGLAVHLLERLPLRVFLESQWTDWKGAARKSQLAGIDGFRSTFAVSGGGEFRLELAPTVGLFLRAGARYEESPWNHKALSDLPAWRDRQLFVDTSGGSFVVASFGLGLSWGYKEGTQDSLDFAFDIGGDSPGFAFTYTFQF